MKHILYTYHWYHLTWSLCYQTKKTCEFTPLLETPILAAFNYSPLLPRDPYGCSPVSCISYGLKLELQALSILPRSSVYSSPTTPRGIIHLLLPSIFCFDPTKKMAPQKKIPGREKYPTQLNQLNPKQNFFGFPGVPENGKQKPPDRPPTMWRTKVDQLPSYRPPGYGWGGWLGTKNSQGVFV